MHNIIIYKPRAIHDIKGQSSHAVLVRMREIQHQEKLRADPRFPLMQFVERTKRYKAIFTQPPYQPIFS